MEYKFIKIAGDMEYKCTRCNYLTTRKIDLDRHLRRKFKCKVIDNTINGVNTNNSESSHRVNVGVHRVNVGVQGVNSNIHTINDNAHRVKTSTDNTDNVENLEAVGNGFMCTKCNKIFSKKFNMQRHEKLCDGLDKKQCKICLKLFTTKQGKWQHVKYVKCNPPFQITNNITNNINNTTIDNSITNITNNNIRVCFGNELLERLCNEDGYMKRIEEYVQLLKYALPKALEDVYFNDKHPQNQTIKKDRRNDNLVSIHVGENRWEKRYAKDMITTTIEKIHDYMEKYIEEVKLTPVRRRYLQMFGKEMSKLKFWTTHSIEDKLDIPDYEESTEEDMKKEEKVVTKLITDKMYERTRAK